MEWLGLGVVGALVFFWWLGREASPSVPPVARPEAEDEQTSRSARPGVHAVAGTGVGLLGALDTLRPHEVHHDSTTPHRWSGADDEDWGESDFGDHAADDGMSDDW